MQSRENRLDQSSLKEQSRLECSYCVAGLYNTEEEHRLHARMCLLPLFRYLDWEATWLVVWSCVVLFTPSRLLLHSRRSVMEVKPRTWKR
jgi:muconolactone delta-isomerase